MSGPYFFVSYAHHLAQLDEPGDPNRWTLKFFTDLSYEVVELTDLAAGQPGFMDRDLQVGQEWERRLARELATCRVFLPLYSPRYFTSRNCGREWLAFSARQEKHEAIIPVLWVPVPLTELPRAARAIQFDHRVFGDVYAREGFLQLIRMDKYKDDYQHAIHELARLVVRVARDGAPPETEPREFAALPSAFGSRGSMGSMGLDAAGLAGPGSGLHELELAGSHGAAGFAEPGGEHEVESAGSRSEPSATVHRLPRPLPSLRTSPPLLPTAPSTTAAKAAAAYGRTAAAKLADLLTAADPSRLTPEAFDSLFLTEVHPLAKADFLRALTPHPPAEAHPRRPLRLRDTGGEASA